MSRNRISNKKEKKMDKNSNKKIEKSLGENIKDFFKRNYKAFRKNPKKWIKRVWKKISNENIANRGRLISIACIFLTSVIFLFSILSYCANSHIKQSDDQYKDTFENIYTYEVNSIEENRENIVIKDRDGNFLYSTHGIENKEKPEKPEKTEESKDKSIAERIKSFFSKDKSNKEDKSKDKDKEESKKPEESKDKSLAEWIKSLFSKDKSNKKDENKGKNDSSKKEEAEEDTLDKKFSSDELLRKATYHLIGNGVIVREDGNVKYYDGVSYSLLSNHRQRRIMDKDNRKFFSEGIVDMTLTIDSNLQKKAYSALVDYEDKHKGECDGGCVIVLNYETGEILAMTSSPAGDAGAKKEPGGNDGYFNRAISKYVPGSVFKSVSIAAALENGVDEKFYKEDYRFNCDGTYNGFDCAHAQAHGRGLKLEKVLWRSCNGGTADFVVNEDASKITKKQLSDFVDHIGLLKKAQIVDMPCRSEGNIEPIDDFERTSFGQGNLELTPIAVARWYAILARGGKDITLHIDQSTPVEENPEQLVSEETSKFLTDALTNVCLASSYPGHLPTLNCKAFGKTGTAETDGNKQNNHAWFVCSLTDEKAPPYTVLVFLKKGEDSMRAKDLAYDFINDSIL